MWSRLREPRCAVPALLLVAAVLLLTSLGHRYLWDDEAETALLARRILAVGLPIAHDGRDLISQGCGWDADRNFLWAYHPWLPMYLTAGSFALLGESTLAARLPFALLGLATVLSLYVVARRLFADALLALIAAATLAVSVPFLLHARQSRYYAVAAFAAVWMIHFFVKTARGERRAVLGLVAASTVMLHANHGTFVGTFVALAVAWALAFGVTARALWRVTAAGALTVALNAPWVVIYGMAWTGSFRAREPEGAAAVLASLASRIGTHLLRIDQFALPALVVVAFVAWLALEGRRVVAGLPQRRMAGFVLAFTAVSLLAVSVFPLTFLRYLLPLLPALAMLQAAMVRAVAVRRPVVAALVLGLLLGTDVLHGWMAHPAGKLAGAPSSPLLAYVGEITHDFDGPIKALVEYLRANARRGDTVFISYGDLPLRFYTDLRVSGGQNCQGPRPGPPPDWIVVRHFFRFKSPTPGVNEDALRMREYLTHAIPWREYERIPLPVPDIAWDSIPEPQYHHFRTPPVSAHAPRLVVYKHMGGSPTAR